MKKSIIWLLALMVVVSMLFIGIGCKTAATTETTAAGATTAAATTAAAVTTAAATTAAETTTGEVVEIKFWDMYWGATWENASRAQVDRFNKEHPTIHVSLEMIPWDNYFQIYLTAVTGGEAPDVSTGAFQQSTQYAAMNKVLPLDSIIEEWKTEGKLDNFPAGSIELHRWDNYQAGIPWVIDNRFITYRQSAFDKAGITQEPKTFDEFVADIKLIKEKTDFIPIAVPSSFAQAWYMFFCNDGSFVDKDGKLALNDPRNVETLEKFFGAIYQAGGYPENSAGLVTKDLVPMYMGGKLAMYQQAMQEIFLPENAEIKKDTKIMLPPTGPSNATQTSRPMAWINPIVAYSQTKYPEQSKIFIKWWVENELQLFKEGGASNMPIFKAAYDDPFYKDDSIYSQMINKILPNVVTPCWPSQYLWSPQFDLMQGNAIDDKIIDEVLLGNKDYKGILDKYQKEMQVYWDENPDVWWIKK